MPPYIAFKLIKLALLALLVWVLLRQRILASNAAALQQLSHLIGRPDPAGNTTVSLLLAHPDDEVMFFSPALASLRELPGVSFDIVCFSNGDAAGLGATRAAELQRSVDLLLSGTPHSLRILDYPDGLDEHWDAAQMAGDIIPAGSAGSAEAPSALLTFDAAGVSGHANHIACHAAARAFQGAHPLTCVLALDSHGGNVALKYSGLLPELARQLARGAAERLGRCGWVSARTPAWLRGAEHPAATGTVRFVSTFPQYTLAYAAMLNAHASQVVWFRYAWWVFSRFVYVNDIVVA